MKKKNKYYMYGALIAILIGGLIVIIISISNSKNMNYSEIEKNYGLSYQSNVIDIEEGKSSNKGKYEASSVVPSKETLINNLENKGFKIEYYEKIFDSNISASQILATKGKHYVNIAYDIEVEAQEVFDLYSDNYNEDKYYILALNGSYVYAISDSDTFKDAGFTTLANDGTQFINHLNE